MSRIPVGATIAHAYRFFFTNTLLVFKAIWLPLLAQLAVTLLLMRQMVLFLTAARAHDPSAVNQFGPLLLFFPLVLLFFFAQFTAASELALGKPPQTWFAFHFGRPMWRLLGGFLSAIAAILAAAIALFLLMLVVSFGMDAIMKGAPGSRGVIAILDGIMAAAFACSIIFFAVRFLFLLAPINITEQRMGVRRSWELSAKNFWRIFLIAIAIAAPAVIINQIYAISLSGLPPALPPGTEKAAREAAEMAWRIGQLNAMTDRWYVTLPLTGILMLFQLGAGCAAQAFAYRKLTDKSEPVANGALPD